MSDPHRRLSKEESRARWRELRTLWNEYDPIRVVAQTDISTDDEYESYIGPVLRLLEKSATQQEIVSYVRGIVSGHMGLPWSAELAARTEAFAERSREWYQTSWPSTRA